MTLESSLCAIWSKPGYSTAPPC